MPITKSAKKKMIGDARKRVINLRTTRDLKQAVKATTAEALPASYKAIDKASKQGIIHKNKAARLKSKLAKHSANS